MESSADLERRVGILEAEMNWSTGTVHDIKKDLDVLKSNIFLMLDRISSLQAHTDERISALQAHTDERISALQAHTDEKFIAVHLQFADVHEGFSGVHKEIAGIHKAISGQTKWLLAVILTAATVISVLHPVVLKVLQ